MKPANDVTSSLPGETITGLLFPALIGTFRAGNSVVLWGTWALLSAVLLRGWSLARGGVEAVTLTNVARVGGQFQFTLVGGSSHVFLL